MAKFMILYNSTKSASQTMAEATPEQMKASMDEWIQWKAEADKTCKMEWGMPLQPVGQVTPAGVVASDTFVGGYATAEADSKEVLLEALKNHPQLKREGGSIDVLEMLHMPGME